MVATSTFIADLTALQAIPPDGILSRTIHQDDQVKAVLFTMDAGQELSDHAAGVPAIIHLVTGQARLTLGDDAREISPGAWVHLPARTPHGLVAVSPLVLLLLLLKARPAATATG